MSVTVKDRDLRFLAGGGEMGELIRNKDWTTTALGKPENWPQSLRTALSIILNSKFPMFLFWGYECICFYNDAYRPSLGNNGKHPNILGERGEAYWPEIWDFIKPLIDQVLAGGEASWNEDQLLPIYRNGKMEDVYWTFSYSPVHDESGMPAGVFVTCTETTEKVNLFKKLEESNQRYWNNIMQTPVAMCIFRGSNHVLEIANNAMLELWEASSEQVLNKPIFEGLPEAKGQGLEQMLDRVYNTGEKFIANERLIHLSRKGKIETTFISFVCEALKEPDGSVSGIIVIATDVSEQVVYQKKLKEDEERLNLVIVASELGTWELNLETRHVKYSDRYLEILGYKNRVELTHAQILQHLHPDDLPVREAAFKQALITGVLHYESRLIWNDQSVHWIEGKGKVFFNEENKPNTFLGTVRDITEEKYFQQQLQEREQKFRLLADSMPQFVWTGDIDGNLNYFNQSVYDYSGLMPEQFQQNGWLQIVHPDDQAENIKKWMDSIQTGNDFLFEHRFRRQDGVYRWQLSRAIPQKDEAGNIQMWVGTSTDIQDQKMFTQELEKQVQERTSLLKESNEKLENSIKELQKMNAELQSFAYVSSHDLQEPLRKIQTFANRIMEKESQSLSETGKDYFLRMQNAASRMQTLIEDLLTYSRTNTTEQVFKINNLHEILNDVKYDLKEALAEKNAVLEEGDMCNANIIAFQFRQLLNNLIGNALKFSKPGIPPHIIIKCELVSSDTLNIDRLIPHKTYCHLSVADNGIGFDPQYKERIFEVFQRLHGKDQYKGTGIGLAIVKKIVENHNGLILANSEIGEGARFDIYIPNI